MPNHATFEEEDLTALLDGELPPAERAALEARLRTEPALQAEYDALAEARSFFAQHGPVAAPADLLGDILAAAARVDAEEGPVVQLAWYKRPLGVPIAGWAVAAAALLVVYVALPGADKGTPEATRVDAAAHAPTKAEKQWSAPDSVASTEAEAPADAQADPAAAGDAVAMIEQNVDGTIGAGLDVPSSRGFAGGEPNKSSPAIEGMAKEKVAKELEAKKLLQLDGDRNSKVADLWKPDAPTAGSGTTDTKQADKSVGFAQVPYQYTLYTDDSQALMQLAAIAGRYRGELAGPNDSALELEELVGTEAATVIVKIPAHALQDFGRAIEGLGNVYSSADNRVFAGDPVEVRVKVQLAAGKPGTENAEPKASRMKQADHEVDQAL